MIRRHKRSLLITTSHLAICAGDLIRYDFMRVSTGGRLKS